MSRKPPMADLYYVRARKQTYPYPIKRVSGLFESMRAAYEAVKRYEADYPVPAYSLDVRRGRFDAAQAAELMETSA